MSNIYCKRCGKEITKKHAIMYHDKCLKCWNKWWNLTHCVNCGKKISEQKLNKDNWCSACVYAFSVMDLEKKYSGNINFLPQVSYDDLGHPKAYGQKSEENAGLVLGVLAIFLSVCTLVIILLILF